MTIDVDPDVHARLAAAAAAAAHAGGFPVSYCDVIRKLLADAAAHVIPVATVSACACRGAAAAP